MENFQVGKLWLISNNSSHNSPNSPRNTNNYTTHNDTPCIIGQYGKIYKGLFFTTPVRIQSLLKQDFKIDIGVIQKPQNHSNIIRFLCSEETDAFHYIATELTNGTLEDLVQRSYVGPNIGSTREQLRQLALGMEHLHNKEVIHGNISPSNIFISIRDGSQGPFLKLGNFGFKKVVPKVEGKAPLVWKEQVFNLEWAAPEVHLDYGEPTYFLDVFALGLTFGFTLIGQHLFGITKSEQIDQIKNCQKMTPKAEQLLLRVGKEALDLVKSMLVSLASQRPRAKQILKHRYFQIQTKESGEEDGSSSDDDDCVFMGIHPSEHQLQFPVIPKKEIPSEDEVVTSISQSRQPSNKENMKSADTAQEEIVATQEIDSGEQLLNGDGRMCSNSSLPFDAQVHQGSSAAYHSPTLSVFKSESTTTNQQQMTSHFSCRGDFPSDREYAKYVRSHIKEGMSIRCCGGFNGLIFGDIGRVINLDRGEIDGLNVQVEWQKNCKTTFVQYRQIEILGDLLPSASLDPLLVNNRIDPSAETNDASVVPETLTSLVAEAEQEISESNSEDQEMEERPIVSTIVTASVAIRWNLDKCDEIMGFCSRKSLDQAALEHLQTLANDESVDINCTSPKTSNSPLLLLCRFNQSQSLYQAIKILLKRKDIDRQHKNKFGHNALSLVARYYSNEDIIDIIRLLVIKYPVSVTDVKDKSKRNVLILLCQFYSGENLPELVELLLDNGADATSTSPHGNGLRNPLILVCTYYRKSNLIDLVELLLDRGTSVNQRDHFGDSAFNLLCAYYTGHNLKDILQLLIDRQAIATFKNKFGFNALLHLCKKQGSRRDLVDLVQFLKTNLVEMDAENRNGRKAYWYLKDKRDRLAIKQLLKF